MNHALPDGWSVKGLAEVADFCAGRTPSRAEPRFWASDANGIPWVSIADMRAYRVVTRTSEAITQDAFREVFSGRIVPKGTLLMSFKLTIGRVAVLGVDACHNEAIVALHPKGVDPTFLGFYLSQVDYAEYQDRAIKGNTLNREKLSRIRITLPPIQEQHRIGAVLSWLQRAMELEERTLDALQELKRATMQRSFTTGLDAHPPADWVRVQISDLGSVVTGTTPKTSEPAYYSNGKIPFLAPGDLGRTTRIYHAAKHITEAGLAVSRPLPRNSVCFVCIGSSIGKVGITVDEVATSNQQINAILPSEHHDPLFLCFLLQHHAEDIARHASPSPVPVMSKGKFERVELFVPSDISEEQRLARPLDVIDQTTEHHASRLNVLKDLFAALLHGLMSGETRIMRDVPDALTEMAG